MSADRSTVTVTAIKEIGRMAVRFLVLAARFQDERDAACALAERRGQIIDELTAELYRRSHAPL